MSKFKDRTDVRYGRLTAISYEMRGGRAWWRCLCNCGKETTVLGASLGNGSTTSCGCLQREVAHNLRFKHGGVNTSTYRSWYNMKTRCTYPSHLSYKDYGGRGIKVCWRWLNSYENFLADMGPRPGPGYSIERKNNDGNYEPDNCKWATRKEQRANQRPRYPLHSLGDRAQTLSAWAKEYGVGYATVYWRMKKGMTLLEALITPVASSYRCPS